MKEKDRIKIEKKILDKKKLLEENNPNSEVKRIGTLGFTISKRRK